MPSSRAPLLLSLAAAVVATATCMDGANQASPSEIALSRGAQSQPVADPGGPYTVLAGQALTFDGSGSYDPSGPDGRLTYDWSLGDGANGAGVNPGHTFPEVGTFQVTLVVTSHKGVASEPAATTVTVVASEEAPGDPENHAPVADAGGPYTGTAGVAIQVDGSGSSDPDGDTPLTYAWDLGDGSSASGVAPTHTYAAAGIYTVTLVVTDSRGLASEPTTTTATIGAANDLSGILVRDTFSRTTTSGWGTPDIGAGWHFGSADPADFRVENGRGYVIKHDNAMRNAVAREGASTEGYGLNVQGIASFRIDTPPDNPNRFYTVQVYARRDDRVSDGDNYYRYRVRAYGRGDMDVRIEKNVNGSSSWITPNTDIDATWEVGQKYWIRWEAAGTSPGTRIRMRVWKDATPEPSAWNLDITVDEPALDVIGTTGFRVSGPSNDQTTFPVVFALDDLEYREID
jgi:PKD repeat protein